MSKLFTLVGLIFSFYGSLGPSLAQAQDQNEREIGVIVSKDGIQFVGGWESKGVLQFSIEEIRDGKTIRHRYVWNVAHNSPWKQRHLDLQTLVRSELIKLLAKNDTGHILVNLDALDDLVGGDEDWKARRKAAGKSDYPLVSYEQIISGVKNEEIVAQFQRAFIPIKKLPGGVVPSMLKLIEDQQARIKELEKRVGGEQNTKVTTESEKRLSGETQGRVKINRNNASDAK